MHILFKAVSDRELGIVQLVGRILSYSIGEIPDTHTDIAEYAHLNPRVLPRDVALAWKFFGAHSNNISVKKGTLQEDQLQIMRSSEPEIEKVKYYFTEDDKTNTTAFMKELMRVMLDEVYDKRFITANLPTSSLEGATWPQQQAEAAAYMLDASASVPMLTALAASRGISVAEMASKVQTAVTNYNANIQTLLAKKQLIEAEIKACDSIAACNRVLHNRFELSMPIAQIQEEGITYSSKFDL
jgi:hypothetical protein